jgi:hypothetical protein
MNDFKFQIGETVQMIMGRACFKHYDGELAVITKQHRTPAGHEVYRMNPLDPNLQQNLQFDSGCVRKLNPEIEPLSDIHIRQISISPQFVAQKAAFLDAKLQEFVLKKVAKEILDSSKNS